MIVKKLCISDMLFTKKLNEMELPQNQGAIIVTRKHIDSS